MEERLQKILAQVGLASRRKAEELILEGRVTVNGSLAVIGSKADPDRDYIKVDGKLVTSPAHRRKDFLYLMFHKPKNVVTTLKDPEGRTTVKEFLHGIRERIFPIGRLDYHSEGLLLLTNDGEFANAVMHLSMKIPKTYLAKVKDIIEEASLEKLRRGIRLEDGRTLPAKVRKVRQTDNNSWIEITITEGRNRQVRRMLERVGHPVIKLRRTAIAGLRLGDLKTGALRELTPEELERFRKELGAPPPPSEAEDLGPFAAAKPQQGRTAARRKKHSRGGSHVSDKALQRR